MIDKNLRTLRKINQLTQEKVAEKINVSRQAVAKWESGETVPDINNCKALANFYNVTIDDLLNYKEEKDAPIPPKGKHFLGTVTMDEQGQIVIPKKARVIFDLQPGDDLIVLGDEEQGIALMKADLMIDFMNLVQESIKYK